MGDGTSAGSKTTQAGHSLNLELHPEQGVPLTLVRMAAERLKDPEVDECWCVFDVEWPKNHPNLFEAKQLARVKGVSTHRRSRTQKP